MNIKPIAHIYNSYNQKFGIPRQSGIADDIISKIVFEPEYRCSDAIRGIEGFSHLWLIWEFSENVRDKIKLTVRPPRLGGNRRVGVFASRSPFRPNPIGLSTVKIVNIESTNNEGYTILVSGADLMNGTPIYDIKPYLSFTDSIPDAKCGFSDENKDKDIDVFISKELSIKFDEELISNIKILLKQNPTPSYHNDTNRVYGFKYDDVEIKFRKESNSITVIDIICS